VVDPVRLPELLAERFVDKRPGQRPSRPCGNRVFCPEWVHRGMAGGDERHGSERCDKVAGSPTELGNHTHSGPNPMNGLAKGQVSSPSSGTTSSLPDPAKGHTYGWKRPDLATQFIRFAALNDWPL